MMKFLPYFLIISCLIIAISCRDKEEDTQSDSFDRSAMLEFWADEIIIPSYEQYNSSVLDMQKAMEAFATSPDVMSLENLRITWKTAYLSWQRVSMFEIGPAESLSMRNFTNIYPTDTNLIQQYIASSDYNLELPSTFVAQGFPAIDYLLFGTGNADEDIIASLSGQEEIAYLSELVNRIVDLSSQALGTWKSDYRLTFIEQDGSSATASVDKMVNDYLFYYEKFFRAGKVGIPAGVFSGSTLTSHVEAPYTENISRDLFLEALYAARSFFNGESVESMSNGLSLAQYLDHVREMNGGEDVVTKLNQHWENIEFMANDLDDNFALQIETDNLKMLELYDEIQKTVILLKVDMLQALNIQVDYVDADGD